MSIQQITRHRLTCDGRDACGKRCPTPPVIVEVIGEGTVELPTGWTGKKWDEDHPSLGGVILIFKRHYCAHCSVHPEWQDGPVEEGEFSG